VVFTVTPYWLIFQLPHWHRFRESYTRRPLLFWIWSSATVWPRLSKSCTGYQSHRGSSTSCAWWCTSRFFDTRRCTSHTYWHQLPTYPLDLHCVLRRLSTSSCCGHVDESATGLSLSPHHGTWSMEQAADTAEAAAVDQYFSSPTENISVPVCLRTPDNRLIIVLWCALGLQCGAQYKWLCYFTISYTVQHRNFFVHLEKWGVQFFYTWGYEQGNKYHY